MKRILLLFLSSNSLFICHSQNQDVRAFSERAKSLLAQPINDKNIPFYRDLKSDAEKKQYIYWKKKKESAILDTIEWRIVDSILLYEKRNKEFQLEQHRINLIKDSLRRDSILKVEIAYKTEFAKRDSIQRETRQEFFSVESIIKNIGKNAYSKENIENSLNIYPTAYQGVWTFYDINDKFISIKYFGLEDICVELGFRIFGEDAALYKKELIQAGFKYQKTFRETMIENHSQGYSNLLGTEIQRYRKYTGKDYVICDIYYDRFTFFKFYRARYKK